MVKSYKVCHAGLTTTDNLQRKPKQLVEAIRHAHRLSSGGRGLVHVVVEVLIFIELGAPRVFFSD